ncbi:MAG: HD-GYP domain-containing protein [Spirochaetaceae bacterium]|jgi:hypothetical protein|nr:HD-GYP domain-containing protein [Spirochaetaceae bacterium]
MKKIPVSDLREGQTFKKPVFIEDDSIFIPENTAVLKKDLDLLNTLGINEVFMQEDAPAGPDVKEAEEAQKTKAPSPQTAHTNYNVFSAINKLIEQFHFIFSAISEKTPANIRLLWHITDSLIEIIKNHRSEVLRFIICEEPKDGFGMLKNAMDTAIISAIMGTELAYSDIKMQEIVAAALLHDVGMLRLPEAVVKKEGPISGRELELMKSHPLYSFNIMKKELLYSDSVCQIALQHHEYWNGGGYPRHLSGKDIDERALIVAVADSFSAMMRKKSYRGAMTGYQVMKTLLSENELHFSPDILKLFVKIMGVYPIGSGVLLNDNSIAQVINVNVESPLRPVVQVIVDNSGAAVKDDRKIDLLTNKNMFIACAVDVKVTEDK